MLGLGLLEMVMFIVTFLILKMRGKGTAPALVFGVLWLPYWLVTGWNAWERSQEAAAKPRTKKDPGGIR